MKEEKENKLLLIKNDIVFKDMFNENQMDTLEWIVMKLLDAKYEDIHGKVVVKTSVLPHTYQQERDKTVDLLVDYNGNDILIELNNNFTGNYMRNLLYAFNIISNHYNKGIKNVEIVKNKTKIILVNLNWHHKNYNHKKVEGKQEVFLEYPEYNYHDYLIKIINVNLDFYYELCYHNIKESDKLWKLFTIENEEDLDSLVKEEELLLGHQRKLLYLSDNEEYKKMIMNEDIERNALIEQEYGYAYHEGEESGIKKGIEQGIEKGIKEGIEKGSINTKKEIVLEMYRKDLPLDIISDCTGLSIDEINNIIQEMK